MSGTLVYRRRAAGFVRERTELRASTAGPRRPESLVALECGRRGGRLTEPEAIYARPMTDQREFFVSYAGEMTPHDREALTRTDRMFFKNEGGDTGRWQGEGKPFVRLRANDAEEAMQLVAEAIGRRPRGLRAREAKPRE